MWPATVVAGMLLLLGAIGTAGTTRVNAEEADVDDLEFCNMFGPFPASGGGGNEVDLENDVLIQGFSYLIVAAMQNDYWGDEDIDSINASIDDESGDADIVEFADGDGTNDDPANDSLDSVPGVDAIDGVDNFLLDDWDTDFIAELEDDFEFDSATDLDDCDPDAESDDGLSFIVVECDSSGTFEVTFYIEGEPSNSHTHEYTCTGIPETVTLTATPTTVESSPAMGNVSHSLLVLTIADDDPTFVAEGYQVDWSTDRCTIRGVEELEYETDPAYGSLFAAYRSTNPATAAAINDLLASHGPPPFNTDDSSSFINDPGAPGDDDLRSIAVAILHCEGAAPGVANVKAEIEDGQLGLEDDLVATTTVTVVGPPAFITMTAAPSKLVCGEKATILVTVTDAINQKVSDHTPVELITNYGGVLGGTGATLGFPGIQQVSPLSSGAAETFGGVATAYLLTSTAHVGAYEVVAAAGGSSLGQYSVDWEWDTPSPVNDSSYDGVFEGNTGVFSTPVVTSQVTVTCTEGAPAVTAPSTGTGTISPPNTGDAGLAAASNSSTASLFVIAGAVAFVLAGLASFGYARRS